MGIKVGDFVTLDYENQNNRLYHEERENLYGIRPNESYEVVRIESGRPGPLVTIVVGREMLIEYTCYIRRVRLASFPNEKVVLWK